MNNIINIVPELVQKALSILLDIPSAVQADHLTVGVHESSSRNPLGVKQV